MWWKAVVKWLRDRVDVDVDLDLDGDSVGVAVSVKLGDATVLAERFEWPLPKGGKAKLAGAQARRKRLAPVGA